MKNKFIFFLLALSCSFQMKMQAQTVDYNLPNILPPAPNAASLGKFAGVNTGLSSGTLDLSIPLLKYASKDLSIPISLSYATNGFKVDEIASRVGNQWSLIAGGVISRTILGKADDQSIRVRPPASLQQGIPYVQFESSLTSPGTIGPAGNYDAQPDIFTYNFNGYRGKFILDTVGPNKTLVPVPLSNSGLKITYQATTSFTITTPDGVQYIFGSPAIEATQTYSTGQGYPNYSGLEYTSWYLNQIVHPNGDVITLNYTPITYNYKLGYHEEVYAPNPNQLAEGCNVWPNPSQQRPTISNIRNINWLQTNGVVLDNITSTYGGKIKFNYTSRLDNNDELLSSVNVYGPDQTTLIKTFNLSYTYASNRPFLASLSESDNNNQTVKLHYFGYNNLAQVPAALSYSLDYWGYFNGKANSGTIPTPRDPNAAQLLQGAGNDRNPDPNYAAIGLLNSVIYPTGGKDSILYEGNQATQITTTPPSGTTVTTTATNSSSSLNAVTTTSSNIVVSYSQQVTISATCSTTSSTPSSYRGATVQIIDANNNVKTGFTILATDGSINRDIVLDPGTYKIVVSTLEDYVTCQVTLPYAVGVPTYTYTNTTIGGVRVAKILTYDGISATPIIKKYIYTKLTDPNQSSALPVNVPVFDRVFTAWLNCGFSNTYRQGPGSCNMVSGWDFYTSTSNAIVNLFQNAVPATYANVTESFGENFDNGGIEHTFTISGDKAAIALTGETIIGATNSNNSYNNGLELYQGAFKMSGTNRVYTSKVFTHYTEDSRFANIYTGYAVTQNYNISCSINNDAINGNNTTITQGFNCNYYNIYKAWIYTDSVTTQTFDVNGTNYVQDVKLNTYNNIDNALPTTETTYASNGDILKINYSYPSDFSTISPYNSMVSEHILNPVIVQSNYRNASAIDFIKSNYLNWGNNIFAPQTLQFAKGTGSYETRSQFYGYDNVGNPTMEAKANGPLISYIWDYKRLYPIAQIKNADSVSVAYTSFEANGSGHWTIPSTTRNPTGFTGKYSYSLTNGPLTKSGLTSTKSYIVSYWTTDSSPLTITGTVTGYPIKRETLNGWTYYEHKVTGITSISVSGTSIVDEVCLYPVDAKITTYAYDPILGLTASVDSKGKLTTYEYDSFQRLQNVKDQYGNIINSFCYNYKGQISNCNLAIQPFTSIAKNGTYQKIGCGSGFTGTFVTYNVAAAAYTSTISQADADNKAQNDVNANGQNYANANGTCLQNFNFVVSNSAGAAGMHITFSGTNGTYTFTVPSSGGIFQVPTGVYQLNVGPDQSYNPHHILLGTTPTSPAYNPSGSFYSVNIAAGGDLNLYINN